MQLANKTILLIITGGIAAYKSLDVIRRLREQGARVRTILTESGSEFVTPLSISALSEEKVYQDLFSLTDEQEMGHIRLARECDAVLVCPATANIIAKLAHGRADDLASTTLLATDKPIIMAPAMNPVMWQNVATQDNIQTLTKRGVQFINPAHGEVACGEVGEGKLADVDDITAFVINHFKKNQPLTGKHIVITAGPTFEPIDPVRFIGNRSSGKQGYAIAEALANQGANVTLISGPTALTPPHNVKTVQVETAAEMLNATQAALPADVFIATAAVADWHVKKPSADKIKKTPGKKAPAIQLEENADILQTISTLKRGRPQLVIGFAAETDPDLMVAKRKRQRKNCDWLLLNKVSGADSAFGADDNQLTLIKADKTTKWPPASKQELANKLAQNIIQTLTPKSARAKVSKITKIKRTS